ncbi:Anthranilate phosphoribosyltransferase [Gammaproteobacteria bacterium]
MSLRIQAAIQRVIERHDLSREEMTAVMQLIMTGQATPTQIGGFLVGLRMKGETVDEVAAAAAVMRTLATTVKTGQDRLIDTCGTGGDAAGTFNISTAAAFVAAAAGARVAKHGNRSISGKTGSADVLEAAGVRLDLNPAQIARCIQEVGVGFLFAPVHHGAMKHAIGPRRDLGVRTLFNILGPLTNPAGASCQLIGVYQDSLLDLMAGALRELGSQHVWVVHSQDGLDEISLGASTQVAELKDGQIRRFTLNPEDFGFSRTPLDLLRVESPAASLAVIRAVLEDHPGPARDIVVLNAGAALQVAGIVADLQEGVARAAQAIRTGEARSRLDRLIILTQSFDLSPV